MLNNIPNTCLQINKNYFKKNGMAIHLCGIYVVG